MSESDRSKTGADHWMPHGVEPLLSNYGAIIGDITEVRFNDKHLISAIDFTSGTTHWRLRIDYPDEVIYDLLADTSGALYRPPGRPRISVGRIA